MTVKKRTIARAKRSAATMGSAGWPPSCVCRQQKPTTLVRNHAARRAFGGNHPPHTITPARRALMWSHTRHGTTPSTTGMQYHAPSNHTGRTSVPHHAPSYHHSIPRTQHDAHRHNGRSHSRSTQTTKMGLRTTLPQLPNGLAFSCRERAGRSCEKRTISRAKRSTAMPGWAATMESLCSETGAFRWFALDVTRQFVYAIYRPRACTRSMAV